MNSQQFQAAGNDRLRFVFDGSVVSRTLTSGATYGDIAQMLSETRRQLHGNPIAIDVTLAYCAPSLRRESNAAVSNVNH